jgi:hypothetical protein
MHRLHSGLTIAIPVRKGDVEKLSQVLNNFAANGSNCMDNFHNTRSTLFISCVILPSQSYQVHARSNVTITIPATLVFATTFSGSFKNHLNDLLEKCYDNLHDIFKYCEHFPADVDKKKLLAYLKPYRLRSTFHSRYSCKTKDEIQKEKELIKAIEIYIDETQKTTDLNIMVPLKVKAMIQQHIKGLGSAFEWAQKPDRKSLYELILTNWFKYLLLLLAGLVLLIIPEYIGHLLIILFSIGVIIFVLGLLTLVHITRNKYPTAPRPDDSLVRTLAATQLRPVLNEMTAAAPLKTGMVRMFFYSLALRLIANIGKSRLEVPTVSNIRWLVVNNKRRLLFLSTYSNTTDFYVREFLTSSTSKGVNFMFTNGFGFPDAKFLIGGGITDDPEGYMNVIHTHQQVTQIWYAHDDSITVDIIRKNAKIRNGLFREMDEGQAQNWLMLL